MKPNAHSTRILLTAILIGIGADRLFFDKQLGFSLLIFVLLFSGGLIFLARRSGTPVARHNLWLFVPLFFFAAMVGVRDNGFLATLNILAVAGLLAYLVLYYATGRVGEFGLLTAAILPTYTAAKSMVGAAPIVSQSVNIPQTIRSNRGNLFAIVRGGLLAAPLLFIFTLFLASADLFFAKQIGVLFDDRNVIYLFKLNIHGLFILGVAWLAAGGLVLALNGRDDAAALDRQITRLRRFRFLGATESTTLFILVDLLFLSFVIVQFRYLFGGHANINLDGYTYAQYARRGFVELLLVAVLSLGVILGLEAITNRQSKRQFRVFNLLSSLMIILVIIMLVSAFRRMRLYEATFGYTELRLYVCVFMIWLGLFLAWFIFGLWRRPDRFALGALIIGMGVLVTVNLLNPEAFIVRQNIARYQAGGKLDAYYLKSLSADAVPALVAAMKSKEGAQGKIISPLCPDQSSRVPKACELSLSQGLREDLRRRFQTLRSDSRWRHWQSFRLSKWLAYQQLSKVF